MKYSFPPRQYIASTVKQHGFVARAAVRHGLRSRTVPVEIYERNTVRLGDFGFLAGNVIHENSGLEHCTQITLLDLKRKIGASSHLQCVNVKEPRGLFHTPSDIKNDIKGMIYTLETLGSNRKDLRSVCIFGTAKVRPAYAEFILTLLRSMEIPVVGGFDCSDADNHYLTDLASGEIKIKKGISIVPGLPMPDPNGGEYERLYQVVGTRPDRSKEILRLMDEAEEYRRQLFRNDAGKKEFRDFTLQRLAAMYFNKPRSFIKHAKMAVDEGYDVSIKRMDAHFMSFEHSGDY